MSSIIFLFTALSILASVSSWTHQNCYQIEDIEHGFVQIVQRQYYQFSCESGYNLQGKTYIACNEYIQTTEKPKCVKRHSYPVPADDSRRNQETANVVNSHYGRRNYNPSNEFTRRDSCQNLHCEQLCRNEATGPHCRCCPGYMLNSNNRTCYLKNTARVNMNECLRKYNKVGHVVLRTCPEGYTFDYDRNDCIDENRLDDNYWWKNFFTTKEPVPTEGTQVVEEVCEKPPSLENGKMECDQGDLTIGKTCRFSCFVGYKLQGTNVRHCMYNNQWSGNVKCVPISDENRLDDNDWWKNLFTSKEPVPTEEESIFDDTDWLGKLFITEEPGIVIPTTGKSLDIPPSCSVNNGGCDHNCIVETPQIFHCECRNGACILKVTREIIKCECRNGYELHTNGKNCIGKSPDITPSCSVNNGGCDHNCIMETPQTIKCECRNGYELHTNGKNCIDIDECTMNAFDCSPGRCVNVPGSAHCLCPMGFVLDKDQNTCTDINECLSKNRCNHFCNNTVGSYFCSCKPGYILIEGNKCEGCRRNSYWSYETNACVDCPRNSHTDSEGKTSIKDCMCNSGFEGSPGDYISCTDIDECSIGNFGCSDDCVNIPGGAYCFCPKGFMLDTDNKTCIDINECMIKNGGCEGLCINTEGNFTCVCEVGFTESTKDRYSCDDIDECAVNNGGCEQLCINYVGGFYCACEEGYHLDSTLKSCTEARCPKYPSPHYTYMDCTYRNVSLPEQNSYPVGTKCIFRCNRGFKNAKDGKALKCFKDGSWKGVLPECKPESCPPLDIPKNGKVHPPSCSQYGAATKQKCTFSCHAGYVLKGDPVFVCRNDKNWNKDTIPVCDPVKILPKIKCPDDIRVTLLPGKHTHNIIVPEPIADTNDYDIFPSWVTTKESVEFPVGVTQVTFTAISTFNETTQCDMTVTVLDEEPPTFHYCPDSITIEDAKGTGEFVTWDDPVVTDNVELVSVFSLLQPNRTLAPGTYFVEYVARDSSGNVGTCSFEISIIRVNCIDLKDPAYGKANCMDWMFGRLCNPECDDGYMRDPEDSSYYSCDDTGIWEPSNSISECLRYTLANSSICEDGYQLKKLEDTGEEICIECLQNAVWSSTTRKCEKITV